MSGLLDFHMFNARIQPSPVTFLFPSFGFPSICFSREEVKNWLEVSIVSPDDKDIRLGVKDSQFVSTPLRLLSVLFAGD
jgi:hypothetical protein